jgi:hypothetical protein
MIQIIFCGLVDHPDKRFSSNLATYMVNERFKNWTCMLLRPLRHWTLRHWTLRHWTLRHSLS